MLSYDDMMEFCRQELGDAVWEIILLENAPPLAEDSIRDGRPRNSRLVNLSVIAAKMDLVVRHFVPVELPLSDVSLVSLPANVDFGNMSLPANMDVGSMETLLRHFQVCVRYMKRHFVRNAEGNLPALLRQWYDNRLKEVFCDQRQALDHCGPHSAFSERQNFVLELILGS